MTLVSEIREERMEWIPDIRARNQRYRDILSLGDRRDIIVLINTIMEIKKEGKESNKRLTGTDENALRRAKQMLYDEFTATSEIRTEDDIFLLLSGELTIEPKN